LYYFIKSQYYLNKKNTPKTFNISIPMVNHQKTPCES
jgi:hypothetical protein